MANKQISDLPVATDVESGDLLVLERNGTAMKVDGSNVGGGVYLITCNALTPVTATHYTSTCDSTSGDIANALAHFKTPIAKASFGATTLTGQLQSIDYSGDTPENAWFSCVVFMGGVLTHGYIQVDEDGDVDINLY